MKSSKFIKQGADFDSELKESLKDPEFRKAYLRADLELELSYGILQMRKNLGMSHSVFAKKIGIHKKNLIAIEASRRKPAIATLQKIAEVFNKELKIEFV